MFQIYCGGKLYNVEQPELQELCVYIAKKRANSTLATFLLNCSLKESILASFFKKLQTEVDEVCKNGNSVLQKQTRDNLFVICEEFVTELNAHYYYVLLLK